MDISVVIPCYDRMDLLERTLRACLAQKADPKTTFEIIVADNHPDQLAKDLTATLASKGDIPLRHVPAPARNIALARNRGVASAQGVFIAFVDDDEAPEPDWLTNHYQCLLRTGADASFGPKYPVFADNQAPEWDPHGWFYTTDFGLPGDSDIRPLDWWPIRGRGLGTGNSMLKKATCLAGDRPFDESFGRTGGEDTKLFFGLARQGRRFVWCPSAKVREFNEKGRLTPGYMRARLERSARHSARCRRDVSRYPLIAQGISFAIGAAQTVVYGLLWVATRRITHWCSIGKGMGKLRASKKLDFVPE